MPLKQSSQPKGQTSLFSFFQKPKEEPIAIAKSNEKHIDKEEVSKALKKGVV